MMNLLPSPRRVFGYDAYMRQEAEKIVRARHGGRKQAIEADIAEEVGEVVAKKDEYLKDLVAVAGA